MDQLILGTTLGALRERPSYSITSTYQTPHYHLLLRGGDLCIQDVLCDLSTSLWKCTGQLLQELYLCPSGYTVPQDQRLVGFTFDRQRVTVDTPAGSSISQFSIESRSLFKLQPGQSVRVHGRGDEKVVPYFLVGKVSEVLKASFHARSEDRCSESLPNDNPTACRHSSNLSCNLALAEQHHLLSEHRKMPVSPSQPETQPQGQQGPKTPPVRGPTGSAGQAGGAFTAPPASTAYPEGIEFPDCSDEVTWRLPTSPTGPPPKVQAPPVPAPPPKVQAPAGATFDPWTGAPMAPQQAKAAPTQFKPPPPHSATFTGAQHPPPPSWDPWEVPVNQQPAASSGSQQSTTFTGPVGGPSSAGGRPAPGTSPAPPPPPGPPPNQQRSPPPQGGYAHPPPPRDPPPATTGAQGSSGSAGSAGYQGPAAGDTWVQPGPSTPFGVAPGTCGPTGSADVPGAPPPSASSATPHGRDNHCRRGGDGN